MRPAFSTVLSSFPSAISHCLCSLAFSLSTVSIWARWAHRLRWPKRPGCLPGPPPQEAEGGQVCGGGVAL